MVLNCPAQPGNHPAQVGHVALTLCRIQCTGRSWALTPNGLHVFHIRHLESRAMGVLQQGIGISGKLARMTFRSRIEGQSGSHGVLIPVLRNADALAHDLVEFHEMLVGVLVVAETARLGIEGNALAQAIPQTPCSFSSPLLLR